MDLEKEKSILFDDSTWIIRMVSAYRLLSYVSHLDGMFCSTYDCRWNEHDDC